MSAQQALLAARELISAPERWAQQFYAYDAAGKRVMPNDPDAVCWCAVGAVHKAGGGATSIHMALDALGDAVPGMAMTLPVYNDSRTHPEILALFDRAIAKLEAA